MAYYPGILHHVKTKGGKALVVQNPGTGIRESMDVEVADTFITFESESSKYAAYVPEEESRTKNARYVSSHGQKTPTGGRRRLRAHRVELRRRDHRGLERKLPAR